MSSPTRSLPVQPTQAQLDLSHLTPEELEQLKKVLKKQEEFEKEIEHSISGLKKTLDYLTCEPSSSQANSIASTPKLKRNDSKLSYSFKSIIDETFNSSPDNESVFARISSSSLNTFSKICFICKRPVETQSNNIFKKWIFKNAATNKSEIIMQCSDCAFFTCKTCGDFVNKNSIKLSTDSDDKKFKWRCKVCIIKREVAKKSGMWTVPNGQETIINELKSNILNTDSFHSKSSLIDSNHAQSTHNLLKRSLYENQENSSSLPTSPHFRNIHFNNKKRINISTLKTNIQSITKSEIKIASDELRNNTVVKNHLNVPEYTNEISSSAETLIREGDTSDNFENKASTMTSARSSSSNSCISLNINEKIQTPHREKLTRKIQSNIASMRHAKLNENSLLKHLQSISYISNPLGLIQSKTELNSRSYLASPLQIELSTPPPLLESTIQDLPYSSQYSESPTYFISNTPKTSEICMNSIQINKSPVHIQRKSKLSFDPIISDPNKKRNSRELKYSDNESVYSSSIDNNFFVPIPLLSSFDKNENATESKTSQIYYGNYIENNPKDKTKIKSHVRKTLPSTELIKKNQQKAQNDSVKRIRHVNEPNNVIKTHRSRKNRANSLIINSLITTNVFKKSQSIEDSLKSIDLKSLDSNDLNRNISEFIRKESNSKTSNNDLTELAKVLLIEFKRSLKKSETTATEDSPISFRSFNSGCDSLSSRQDSSMSAGNENERSITMDDKIQPNTRLRPNNALNETKRNHLRNSEEWHNRRKDIMKKTKRWSSILEPCPNQEETFENALSINNDSFYQQADDSFMSNCELNNETNHVQVDDERSNTTRSTITHCFKSNQISIYHSDFSHNSTESNHSSKSINNVANSNESSHSTFNSNESSSSPNNVVIVPRQCRKLPKIPITEKVPVIEDNLATVHSEPVEQNISKINNHKSHRKTRASLDCNDSLKKTRNKKDTNPDSLSSSKNFSKSIDSIIEANSMKNHLSLSFKSVPKSLYTPQRSIDYPYILRKTPKLSDIVRKRLLFQKVSRHATLFGDWNVNSSTEKEHVPKAVRKMIIRQDNSIEISMSRPPKLRQHTMSEDIASNDVNNASDINPNAMQGLIVQNTSCLSVSSIANDRRKTIETCENIFLQSEESTKLRARTPPSNPHRILLYKDKSDKSIRTNGLGMRLIGGHECEDGSLGCFVTLVIKGGPADMNNIEVGDQILEFNGHSLIDSTYEEVRHLQNNGGDYVQLVVQHNNIRTQIGTNGSPIGISRHFQTVPRLCQSSSRRRRNLPPLTSSSNQSTQKSDNKLNYIVAETLHVPNTNNTLRPILINRGRLLMQIWNDIQNSKLAITINQATNLPSRSESEQWSTYVIGRVIFEEQSVQNFQTRPILGTNPVWSETFVFTYVEPLEDVNVEIYLHDTQTPSDTRILQENFIGMIMLPLSEANLEDEPRWYDMKDKPTRKNSNTSVTFKSSSNDSQDSLSEKRKIGRRHSSRKSSMYKSDNSSHSNTHNGKIFSPVRKLSQVFSRLFRRSSESGVKRNLIRFENEEEETIFPLDEPSVASSRSNRSTRRRNTELLTVNFLLPPDVISMDSSTKPSSLSIIEAEEDIDYYFKSQMNNQTPGAEQMNPAISDAAIGDIKLGFVMSKGQLEITVFEARNLKKLEPNCRDTYVKTYLRTGTHRLQKRKTNVVRNSSEPVFNSKLLYNACNVLGRRIQVIMIWQKAPKLDKNQCIGEAFIQLDHLDLSHQTIGWYKLYKQHAVESEFYDST